MLLNDERTTHYDVLELKPDASPQQIREAYIRAKSTYHKDNAALYSMVSAEEREEALLQIEEAYKALSNPQQRKEYDRQHGFLVSFSAGTPRSAFQLEPESTPPPRKIISIDRIPPMENLANSDETLFSPPTHFSAPEKSATVGMPPMPPPPSAPDQSVQKQIEGETEWSGAFLKKVREASGISIEEIASITKINKHYLFAIEEENFAKLPASVYVRGFITQMSKLYKIPMDRAVNAYMSRLILAREPKKK